MVCQPGCVPGYRQPCCVQLCVGGVWTHLYLCSLGPPHLFITYLHACGVLCIVCMSCCAILLFVAHTLISSSLQCVPAGSTSCMITVV
jgi:hypothetical protein